MRVFRYTRVTLILLLAVHLFSMTCWGKSEESTKAKITLEKGLLSVEAKEVSVESIVREMGSVCNITIVASDGVFPTASVSVKFKDKPLEKGIKKILRVSRMKNYLIRYQESDDGYKISRIEFLGKGGTSAKGKADRKKRK